MPTQNDAMEVTAEVIERTPPTRHEVDPMRQWEAMLAQAQTLVRSGFLPKAINTVEKALAVMQTGKEFGIGAMQSLRAIHIIDAKPTMAAELIAGLVLSRIPGATLRVAESTNERCIVEAGRAGDKITTFTWTMEDAQRAGLVGKDNWKKYPRAMLRSRTTTEAARAIFPDATMGLHDPDELGAITGERGEIIALPSAPQANRGTADEVQADIEAATHGSADEAKRQKILNKAMDVMAPLMDEPWRYVWAMDKVFGSHDWNVIKGYSLNKLDADTRGRITQIVEQAKDTSEEQIAELNEKAPPVGALEKKKDLIAAIRQQIERIPEGAAREAAMSNAFGSVAWMDLESYSLKEIEEVVEGGRVAKIVEDALRVAG